MMIGGRWCWEKKEREIERDRKRERERQRQRGKRGTLTLGRDALDRRRRRRVADEGDMPVSLKGRRTSPLPPWTPWNFPQQTERWRLCNSRVTSWARKEDFARRRHDCRGRRARGPEFAVVRREQTPNDGRQTHTHGPTHTRTHASTHVTREDCVGLCVVACDRKISRDLINVRLTKSNLINIAADWRRHLSSDPREREYTVVFQNWARYLVFRET